MVTKQKIKIRILLIGILLLALLVGIKNSFAGIPDIACPNLTGPNSYGLYEGQLELDGYTLRCAGSTPTGIVRHWTLDDSRWNTQNPRKIFYMVKTNGHSVVTASHGTQLVPEFIDSAVRSAFQTWQDALHTMGVPLVFEQKPYIDDTNFNETRYKKNGYITIEWYKDKSKPKTGFQRALTLTIDGKKTGYMKSSSIYLNADHNFGDAYYNEAVYDLQGVVTHEIGHSLGLGDYPYRYKWYERHLLDEKQTIQTMQGGDAYGWDCIDSVSLINKWYEQCKSKELRTLEEYDIKGLAHIYSQYSPPPQYPNKKANLSPAKINLVVPHNRALHIDIISNILFKWEASNTTVCTEISGVTGSGIVKSPDPDCGDKIRYKLEIKEDGGIEGDRDDTVVFSDFIESQHEYSPITSVRINKLNLKSKLNHDKTYWWAVWAQDEHGAWSPASEWFHFTTRDCPSINVPNLYKLKAYTVSENYTISWSSMSKASSYTVQEDTNPNFLTAKEYTSDKGSLDFVDKLEDIYYYRVKANSSCAGSIWSNTIELKVDSFQLDMGQSYFEIFNDGQCSLTIKAITLQSDASWGKGLTPSPPFNIAPNNSVKVSIKIDKNGLPPGEYKEFIHVLSDDPDTPDYPVEINLNVKHGE